MSLELGGGEIIWTCYIDTDMLDLFCRHTNRTVPVVSYKWQHCLINNQTIGRVQWGRQQTVFLREGPFYCDDNFLFVKS